MKWVLLSLALAGISQAGLRFGCSTLSIQRLDPLVQPGSVPSAHVHQIIGGNAFNATITTKDVSADASCTTCVFSEDFSNYWTAALYFKARNGSYHKVPLYPNADLDTGITGGMTVYYTQQDFNTNGNQHITAFPAGFRMTVGNAAATTQQDLGITYTCLQTIMTRGAETAAFPTKACPAGIMAIHHFPACWDGKNLDSPDHQTHASFSSLGYLGRVYSTSKGGFQVAGACPASHPIRMPQLAYETMWNTTAFNDKSLWPTDGSQPFVWSMGDSKGYASHADYVFGWKGDALQRAMNSTCMFGACGTSGVLKTQTQADFNKCNIKSTVQEQVDGWLTELPGHSM